MLANFARQFTLRTTATAVRPAAVVARQFAGTSGTGGAGAPARAPPRLWQLQLREQRGAQRAAAAQRIFPPRAKHRDRLSHTLPLSLSLSPSLTLSKIHFTISC